MLSHKRKHHNEEPAHRNKSSPRPPQLDKAHTQQQRPSATNSTEIQLRKRRKTHSEEDASEDTVTQREDSDVKMEAEIGVVLPQAEECQRLPEANKRQRRTPSLQVGEGALPFWQLDLDF